ncbi:MAG TPA: TonB-dependent receptor [Bryobacteraceae bacterium]|nr:TonB-dependent receptor [Bryobacteraceae bacterium]
MTSFYKRILSGTCSALFLAIAFLGLQTQLYSQVLYGSLVGTVTDPSGAVIPSATVTATNVGTQQTRTDVTDSGGRYNLTNLLPGTYSVKIEAKGFRAREQAGVNITPNTVARIDAQLEVGQATEQVEVSATAVQLQTDKADTHTEITSKQVTNMPLGGYRNYQTLINLTPGATPGNFFNSLTDVPGQALNNHINGGSAQTNVTRIDGAESINVWLPQYTGYVVPAETVDVVNVTTSAAEADQGLAGASAITVVTKSGTNELHGSAYEFHNNQHLNARNFFLQPGVNKPVSIYNNYGATLGGPIIKNKLFYFGSFDGLNLKQTGNGIYSVPTADQRAGNFSAYSTKIYDPTSTTNTDGTGRTQFPGNIIPTSMISPAAQKIQTYFPLPNLPGTSNNFAVTSPLTNDKYQYDTKINWNRTDKHSIWGKYDLMKAVVGGSGIFGAAGGPATIGSPGTGHTTIQVGSIGHTYIFSPTVLLDGNVGYERQKQNVTGTDFGTNYGSVLGIPGMNGPDIRQSGFPDLAWLTYTGMGVPNWMPLFRTDETYTTSHNLTWTKGAHELRFGFDMVRHHLNHWQPELSFGGPRGYFDFSGQVTALKGGASPNQYNSYAQFLLGYADDVQKGLQYILMTGREWQFGWYAQDRWQVSRKLTVDLGLRYELYPLMTRCCGKGIERYDPSNNNVYMGGRGNVPEDVGITVSHKMFAPRLGIAYRLGEKTVIRTGYGLNYDPLPFSRPLRGYYPLTVNADTTAPNGFAYARTLAQGIPPVVGPDLSTGIIPLPGNASERSPWGGEIHRGYVQSWNFTIERELPLNLVTSVGYVGQHSVHLMADYDINAGYPGSGTTGLPYYAAYKRTIATQMWDGYLSSEYNSLQVAVSRQFSKGLMLKGAYTWSHAIDYTDDDGWASVGWNWAPMFQRNRATAGFDRTHVFQLGWVYDLPVGKGKQFVNSGVASTILGGWEFSGIESMYTGTPFTVTAPGTSLNAPDNTQTADLIAPVQFTGAVGPGTHYYNPASFAAVTTQRFGNMGRNVLRNPGLWNTDMTISRIFPIKERTQLQFRAEFYNLPNTSHFGSTSAPWTTQNVSSGSFMTVTSAYGERNVRFALRLQW